MKEEFESKLCTLLRAFNGKPATLAHLLRTWGAFNAAFENKLGSAAIDEGFVDKVAKKGASTQDPSTLLDSYASLLDKEPASASARELRLEQEARYNAMLRDALLNEDYELAGKVRDRLQQMGMRVDP